MSEENVQPFTPGSDSLRYLTEVAAVLSLATAAICVLIFGNDVVGLGLFLAAGIVALITLRVRAERLPVPTDWPVDDWNRRDREMKVFRWSYVKGALADRELPASVGVVFLGLCVLALGISLWFNRHFFF